MGRGLLAAASLVLVIPNTSHAATRQYVYAHSTEWPCANAVCNPQVETPRGNVQANQAWISVTVTDTSVTLIVDDAAALNGQTVPIEFGRLGHPVFRGCMLVRSLRSFSGLTPGEYQIRTGRWDQGSAVLNGDIIEACDAPATAGTLTITGVA